MRQNADARSIEGATMTGHEMRAIRKDIARIGIYELASLLRYRDVDALRKMEEGHKPVTGPIQCVMEMIRDGKLDASAELS
jgi:hypothetical protein